MLNHTSDQHPWFKEARSSPDSPKRDYYVWSDTDDRYRGVRIIFRDTEMSNWAWDPVSKAYYWHRFFSHQPDLNFDNPAVREEIWQVMRFWLELGVDGFRVDAVPYLVEREGTSCENLPETHEVVRELRRRMDAEFPGRMLLAEANMWPEDVRPYFGDGDGFHMAFHFPLMPRMFMALRLEDRKPLVEIVERTPEIPASCQWGLFLRNHDELTLEMVTDAERDYMYEEYARDPVARINLGIRRRLAPLLDGDRRRIELMNALLLSLPGSPVLYYGDEIGMGDNVYLGDRNGVRTPMQWTGGWNGGFSTADPERLYQPLISNPVYGYQAVNVESQRRQENSLLNWTKRLIQVRRSTRVFGRGTIEFLKPANHRVLAYVRSLDSEKVLVVNNLSGTAQAVELDLHALRRRHPHRDVRPQPLPADPRAALRDDPRPLRLLLVQAALAVSTILSDELLSEPHGGRPGGRAGRAAHPQPLRQRGAGRARRPRGLQPRARAGADGARERGRGLDGRHARHRPGRLDRGPGDPRRLPEPAHPPPHQRARTTGSPGRRRRCAPSSPPPTSSRRGRSSSSTPRSRA